MQRFTKRSSCIFTAIVLLSAATHSKLATGAIVRWSGTSGNWTDPSNWENASVPGLGNNYGINNDGTAIIDTVVPDIGDIGLGWPSGNTRSGHIEIHAGGSLTTTTTDGVDVGVRGGTDLMSSVKITGGTLNITGGGYLVIGDEGGSHGTVEISSGSISVSGPLRIGAQGEGNFIIHGNSPSITVGGNLTFHEAGSAFSRLNLHIGSGGISPIQVAGNTTLDNNPELLVSLSALAPTTDLVLVDNSATSALNLVNTFFNYADGAPVSAVFGSTTYNWAIDYDYGPNDNDIALVFVSAVSQAVPGDFDADGDVDGADFVAWQTNFPAASGASLAQGDADNDGDVDGADFVVWQTNFPFTPGPGVAAVPEPSSGLLAVLACAVVWRVRRLAPR